MTKKLITKTKYILSKNGESLLIRYLFTDQCDMPVRIFEFDIGHYEDILYQVNTSIYNLEIFNFYQFINILLF